MLAQLREKWVVVTGASSGFGEAISHAFAAAGAKLILGARRMDRLAKVAEECRRLGTPKVVPYGVDVSSTASVEEFAAKIRDNLGSSADRGVQVLVNNAGGAHGVDTVADGKDSDWETMLQVNVMGVLRMTRALLPLMPHHAGSYIINIGSVAGHTAYEGGSAYCAAKAGELQITRALRLELNGTGIRVGTVDPGLAETEFSEVRFKGDLARARKVYEGIEPLTANDIAETVLWLASRPPHVCIDEVIIKPTDQAAVHKVFRRTAPGKV